MVYHTDDTIAAIATAAGGAARGIVRVSGREAIAIASRCFVPEERRSPGGLQTAWALRGRLRIGPEHGPRSAESRRHAVPCDLYAWPTERSYTREPVAELHTIGSRPVLEAALAAVCESGARLAEPGEFTLRAFLAARIDLTQAEAVLGVIDARGQTELQASLAQLAGGLSRPLDHVRDELLQLLAELEAGLDFAEEDIVFVSRTELADRLGWATRRLSEMANQMASRLTPRDAAEVALIGPPNVGKSSLFNVLVRRHGIIEGAIDESAPRALVSSCSGTTRDYLTAVLFLDGIRCELIDTAGIDGEAAEPIESAAQQLSGERRSRAVIRAWCSDGRVEAIVPSDCDLVVLTKADVIAHSREEMHQASRPVPVVVTSSHTGEGLEALSRELRGLLVRETTASGVAVVAGTAQRCRDSMRLAKEALRRATTLLSNESGQELVAAEIRLALGELGKVVGAVYTDDLLGRIFSKFCIGK